MNCNSCGMPMDRPQDHGGGRPDNPYCIYCTRANGSLRPMKEVRERMIHFYMQTEKASREEAEKYVDELMARMPAWKSRIHDLKK